MANVDFPQAEILKMENGWSSEQDAVRNQLIQGMDFAKRLREELAAITPAQDKTLLLVEGILSSYQRALSAMKWSAPNSHPLSVAVVASVPTSPNSVDDSPQSDDFDMSFKDHDDQNKGSKKRKSFPRWTKRVRVSSETGLEGSYEDGHGWRKYGQKDILGAKYPRSYYRCTFRNTQDCWATKQVQRSDEDPSVFEITYRGKHACSQGNHTIPPQISSEKVEQKQISYDNDIAHELQSQKTLSTLICPTEFGLTEIKDPNTLPESHSLIPESSYLMQFPSMSNSEGFHSLQQPDTNITELLSQYSCNYFTSSELGFLT